MRPKIRFTVKAVDFIQPLALLMTALFAAVCIINTLANGFQKSMYIAMGLFLLPFWLAWLWAKRFKVTVNGEKLTARKLLRTYQLTVNEITRVKSLYRDNRRMQLESIKIKTPRGTIRLNAFTLGLDRMAAYLAENVPKEKHVSAYLNWINMEGRDATHFVVKRRGDKFIRPFAWSVIALFLVLDVIGAMLTDNSFDAHIPTLVMLPICLGLLMCFGLFRVTVEGSTLTVRRHTGRTYRFSVSEIELAEREIHHPAPRRGFVTERLIVSTPDRRFSVHGYMEGYEELWNYLNATLPENKVTVFSTYWNEPGKRHIHKTPQKGRWI